MNSIILGSVIAFFTVYKCTYYNENTSVTKKHKFLRYRTLGLLLWPVIFISFVPKEDMFGNKIVLCYMWPILMWLLDLYLLVFGNVSEFSKSSIPSMRMDPSTISSMSFALFGFLGGSQNNKYSHIFLYTILICIAFVFPSNNIATGSDVELLLDASQKTILGWCLGLLFTAVSLQKRLKESKDLNDVTKS